MPISISGNSYLCIFTDVSSRLSSASYLKVKGETKMAYYAYCKHIRNKTGNYPKYVHTDGGGEFIDKEVKAYNTKRGITHTYTSPLSSQQNPIAERVNRTIGEGSLSLLTTANLPSSFWEYAVSTFMFIRNRAPHKSLSLSNPLTEWNIYNKNESNIDIYD